MAFTSERSWSPAPSRARAGTTARRTSTAPRSRTSSGSSTKPAEKCARVLADADTQFQARPLIHTTSGWASKVASSAATAFAAASSFAKASYDEASGAALSGVLRRRRHPTTRRQAEPHDRVEQAGTRAANHCEQDSPSRLGGAQGRRRKVRSVPATFDGARRPGDEDATDLLFDP